jgi:cytochrome P450
MINIYGLHRHPDLWDAPEEFRPQRMLDPAAWDPNRFAYLPFGAGPRGCIGSRFSILELQIVLSSLARAFRFEATSRTEVTPSPQFTLKTGRPIHLRLIRQVGQN